MKKLTLICVLVMLLGISSVAFAETQSIRVSGDISIYQVKAWYDTFYYDATGANESNAEYFWLGTLGLNFDADLTENVSGRIRLVNHRPWDLDDGDTVAMDIGIAEAYITLREMLYEPLTLTIGRQPLYYGRGFVVGSNVIDPEGQVGRYDQYSLQNAFDAVKAELDYAPWTIDLVYSLISEEQVQASDDINLWIANIGYEFDEYNGEMEGYYVGLRDRNRGEVTVTDISTLAFLPNSAANIAAGGAATTWQTSVRNIPAYESHTLGARGSFEPVENLSLFGEAAYQFGDIGDASYDVNGNIIGVLERDVSAWGAEVGGDYAWVDVTGEPALGLCYSFREGENFGAWTQAQGDYDAFYTPFTRRSDTAIFGHNGRYGIGNVAAGDLYYRTGDFANSVDDDDTAWDTNMHQVLVTGSVKPLVAWDVEDVLLSAKYAHFIFEEKPISDGSADDNAGDELDLILTYDYTEDVSFGLLWAYFWPGDYYDRGNPNNQANAADTYMLETSVKLTF